MKRLFKLSLVQLMPEFEQRRRTLAGFKSLGIALRLLGVLIIMKPVMIESVGKNSHYSFKLYHARCLSSFHSLKVAQETIFSSQRWTKQDSGFKNQFEFALQLQQMQGVHLLPNPLGYAGIMPPLKNCITHQGYFSYLQYCCPVGENSQQEKFSENEQGETPHIVCRSYDLMMT